MHSQQDLEIGCSTEPETVTFHRVGDLVSISIYYIRDFDPVRETHWVKASSVADWDFGGQLLRNKLGHPLILDWESDCRLQADRDLEGEISLQYLGAWGITFHVFFDEDAREKIISWFNRNFAPNHDTADFDQHPIFGL